MRTIPARLLTLQNTVATGIDFTILPWSVASKVIVPGKSRVYELCCC
ncbi:putative LysR family transcriptional regulatory protein [Acetobacter pomorum]|nr:putative LysR family transcriptional regulatory protein [Acetobacter pomorum]